MSVPVNVGEFVWIVCGGRYLINTEVLSGRSLLQGVDSAGIRYNITFNPGDRFRDSDGWTIEFSPYGAPYVDHMHKEKPKHIGDKMNWYYTKCHNTGLVELYSRTENRIVRLTSFISLSFRKDRKSFTLMFKEKYTTTFS